MRGKHNFSVLSWGYATSLCIGLGIVPSKKKLVSAALSLDENFFLIHHKKRGQAEIVVFNNIQHSRAAVALFGRNIGIGVWCHPPSCSVVGVEDGGSVEMSNAVQAGDTFNVVVFGNEGRGIELSFEVETHKLRNHVGYQCVVGRNNL